MLRKASRKPIIIEKFCEIIATSSTTSRSVFRNVKVSKIYACRKHYVMCNFQVLFKKRGITNDESILLKEVSKGKIQLFIPKV